jgi:hypothetical protein
LQIQKYIKIIKIITFIKEIVGVSQKRFQPEARINVLTYKIMIKEKK